MPLRGDSRTQHGRGGLQKPPPAQGDGHFSNMVPRLRPEAWTLQGHRDDLKRESELAGAGWVVVWFQETCLGVQALGAQGL